MKNYTIFDEIKYLNTLLTRRFIENFFGNCNSQLTRVNALIIKYLIDNQENSIFQKDIEEKFGITKSTASKVLKLMETKGLIERQPLENDTRYKKLIVCEKAKEIHNNILASIQNEESLLLNNFNKDEIETFKKLLNKLKTNIKEINKKENKHD